MRLTSRIRLLLAHLLVFNFLAEAGSAGASQLKAPPLRFSHSEEKKDLGVWNDVFACEDQDIIALRRGEEFFSLSLNSSATLKKLATASAARRTRIVDYAGSGDRLWLFLQSDNAAPCAIDARSGKVSHFGIPDLKIPGSNAPVIQSCVIIPHADAAILMISGGDPETWPRGRNDPLYYWMSLKSGKVVALPIGWDLVYFSSDLQVAVFAKPQLRRFEHRTLQAVDVRTGDLKADTPARQNNGVTPFNWSFTQRVQPIYLRRPDTGAKDYFAGISVNGSVFPFAIETEESCYLSTAKENKAFAGFRLQCEGAFDSSPNKFWITDLKQKHFPELVASGVTHFTMLDGGNCVIVTDGHGRKRESLEASFRSDFEKTPWNVLDGVERLPDLDREFIDKSYIADKMTVRLIDGFGDDESLVLCFFSHFRGDMRANYHPEGVKRLEMITWRRAMIVTSAGDRYLTDLFREEDPPNLTWLHNSGRIITANYLEPSSISAGERRAQLSETTLHLQR